MNDIFISYASADRSKARALSKRLEKQGWTVWWDRDIPPGQSFSKVLEDALFTAKCVVVLWSNTSRSSDWVQNEAAEGKRRNILVPAFIEETTPPFEFRRIQAANLVGWEEQQPGNELIQFFEAIERVLRGNTNLITPPDETLNETTSKDKLERQATSGTKSKKKIISPWIKWGRLFLLIVIMGLSFMMIFKTIYPQTPVTEALTAIFILSIISGAVLNLCLIRWTRRDGKN